MGITLQKHADANFVRYSGDLIVERRLGRGRIVVTAFRLSSQDLRSWSGMDELLNAFLLRRPARKFGRVVNRQFADSVPVGAVPPGAVPPAQCHPTR